MTHYCLPPIQKTKYAIISFVSIYTYAFSGEIATEELDIQTTETTSHCDLSLTELKSDELQQSGIYSLSEALQNVAGVFVIPNAPYGHAYECDISMRGMSLNYGILPVVDGLRLNQSYRATTSLIVGQSTLFNIGTVDVLRGAQSSSYGSGAIGGVLILDTPEGQGEPSNELFAEYGSFNTATASLTSQGQVEQFSYFVNLSYQHSANDVSILNPSSTYYKNEGQSDNAQVAIRFDYELNEDNKSTFTYRNSDIRYRNPLDDANLYQMGSNLLSFKHSSEITDWFSSSLCLGYYDSQISDSGEKNQDTASYQIEWKNCFQWQKKHTFIAEYAWMRSSYHLTSPAYTGSYQDPVSGNIWTWDLPAGGITSKESTMSFLGEYRYEALKNWITSYSMRYDKISNIENQISYIIASQYKFNEEKTKLSTSLSTGYRSPAEYQTYAEDQRYWGMYHIGNDDLLAEKSISFDFCISHNMLDTQQISLSYFWLQTRNMILFNQDIVPYTYYNEEDYARSQGLELSLSGQISQTWDTKYTLSFTYMRPEMEDGTQIVNTAKQMYGADINTRPTEKLLIGLGLNAAIGRSSWTGMVDDFYTLRLYANYQINERLHVHLRIENLTNQKYIINPSTTSEIYYPSNLMNNSCDMINSGLGIYAGFSLTF